MTSCYRILPSLKILPSLALVAGLLCLGTGIGFGPETASAQTAKDLRCRQCVNRGDIRKGAVSFNRLQSKVQNRIAKLESAAELRVPFYVTLDGDGAEQTIVTNGPIRFFARCRVDDTGNDRVEIVATSSTAGWFAERGAPSGNGPFAAFEEVVVMDEQVPTGTASYDDDDSETSAATPDGSFIGIAGEATGLGINIFGHDCLVTGNAFLANGTL